MSPILQELVIVVVKILVIFNVLLALFSGMTYLERRLLAFMQFRLGPNRTGPWGLLQPVADGIKLFFKEETMPEGADRFAFIGAPAGRSGISAATVPGMIVRQVWISPSPRPAGLQ